MVPAIIAALIILVMVLLYGGVMLFTDYIKATLYVKAIALNLIWFLVAEGYEGYDIYYPSVFENKWLNLLLMTIAVILIVLEISRFVKLRNAMVISVGAITHIVATVLVINFCGGDIPGWVLAIYIGVSSCIVFGIHIATIYGRSNTMPGNFFSRVLAGLLMAPAPFVITSACMLVSSANEQSALKVVPFKEFIDNLYNFITDPKFNFSGTLTLKGMHYTRNMLIMSLIVAIIVFILYIIADSTVDFRSEMKESRKHRKAAEKERIRNEISGRIRAQLDKIDSCMAYLSTNSKQLKISVEDLRVLRTYYEEASRIKYSYNGAASGPILKRVTEIRTEMCMIRDRLVNHIDFSEAETKEDSQANAGPAPKDVKAEVKEDSVGYFNDCKTSEEIKKRYRDLCKVFHPDSGIGDPETFLKVKEDYERLMEIAEAREKAESEKKSEMENEAGSEDKTESGKENGPEDKTESRKENGPEDKNWSGDNNVSVNRTVTEENVPSDDRTWSEENVSSNDRISSEDKNE